MISVQSEKKCPKCGAILVPGGSYCQRCGSRIFADSAGDMSTDPYIGTVIDDTFEVRSILGTGSMGIVYRAYHRILNCEVALKVLRHDFLNDRVVQARFQREAQAASSLSHPNIIQIMHYGRTPLNAPYIAMECLNGKELSTLISEQFPLSPKRVCRIAAQTAYALTAAHKANIIHRDLKPANIIVVNPHGEECVKVLDFGIAKIADVEGEGLTREGAICGTPAFMSPEQVIGKNITPLSDIFSLGSTLYYMLTCRLPFHGDSLVDMSRSVMAMTPTPPSQARLDCYVAPELEAICLRALEKDPADRFQSAEEMANALDACLPYLPDSATNIKPKIVVQSSDSPAVEDLSGATQCIKAYDENDDIDEELEEAGTVVEMPAYPSGVMPSVHSTLTNTENSASKNPVAYAVSQVLDVIKPASLTNRNLEGNPNDHRQLIKERKRLLLGLVCILISLCLIAVVIICLISIATRPESPKSHPAEIAQNDDKNAVPNAEQKVFDTKNADRAEEKKETAPSDPLDEEDDPFLGENALIYNAVSVSGSSAIYYAVAYGAADIPDDDLEQWRKDHRTMRREPDSANPKNAESEPSAANRNTPKTSKTSAKKSASSKSAAKNSKAKTTGSKNNTSVAGQLAQAEKLERSGDKVKACTIYRQILKQPGISQAEKLKVQAKVRNCTRISI